MDLKNMDLKNILSKSYELRKKIIDIIYKSGKGHLGGASIAVDGGESSSY